MAGELGDDPREPTTPPPIDDEVEWDNWTASVEVRLKNLRLTIYAETVVATAALGIGFMALKGVNALMKSMSQIAEVTNNLSMRAYGIEPGGVPMGPSNGTNQQPAKVVFPIDETPTASGPIAEPVSGPETEASQLMQSDPIAAPSVDELSLGERDYSRPGGVVPEDG